MFPNIKLYEHQPTIKLEIAEPLPNRRQDIILSKIRVGRTYLKHAYLLKGEIAPWCTCCNQLLTVRHILVDCEKYKNICKKSDHAITFALLVKDVPASQIIEYLWKNRLLPTPIKRTLLEICLTILSLSKLCWSKSFYLWNICFQIIHIIYMYK